MKPHRLPSTLSHRTSLLPRHLHPRLFFTTPTLPTPITIYPSIRYPDTFHTLLATSTATNTPLVTYWTTSACPTCKIVRPLLEEVLKGGGVREGTRVGFVEVEMDAPDVGWELGSVYSIGSIPTLLAFRRSHAQTDTTLYKKDDLTNRETLIRWIEDVAKQGEDDRKFRGSVLGSLWSQ